jgi:hypothetical protein
MGENRVVLQQSAEDLPRGGVPANDGGPEVRSALFIQNNRFQVRELPYLFYTVEMDNTGIEV